MAVDKSFGFSGAAVAANRTVDDGSRQDLVEERLTRHTGVGLFALQDIPPGTRIFHESPLIHLPADADIPDLARVLKLLNDHQRRAFTALSFHKSHKDSPIWINDIRNEYSGRDEDFDNYCDDLLMSWLIYKTNRFTTIRSEDDTPQAMALFVNAARLNHSCQPNVFHRYNKLTGKMGIYTTRHIYKGEQLVTSYIDICRSRKERRRLLRYWGFDCDCTLCASNSKVQDARRKKIGLMMTRMKKDAGNDSDIRPKDHISALKDVALILELMRQEGMNEPDTTGTVYDLAVAHCIAVGRTSEAHSMLRKRLEVLQCCLGIDSEDYKEAHKTMSILIHGARQKT